MSNNKWRVVGAHGYHDWINWKTGETGTERCTRWSVEGPDGRSRGEFPTHAEALAHADEQARTVTVTLPAATSRAVFDAGRGYTTYVNWDSHGWAWLESDGGIFAITDHEREPLALHLLAHNYAQK